MLRSLVEKKEHDYCEFIHLSLHQHEGGLNEDLGHDYFSAIQSTSP